MPSPIQPVGFAVDQANSSTRKLCKVGIGDVDGVIAKIAIV
jgi:hypothetical protein